MRKAGVLCQHAMEAMVARAKPGVKEYELRAAAGAAILDGGGDIDFLIIGSTPMDEPGDDLRQPAAVRAACCRRATSSTWSWPPAIAATPRRSARRSRSARRPTWCASSGTRSRCPATSGSSPRSRPASRSRPCAQPSKFFRDKGVQSRPTQMHGIDIVTDKPHVVAEHVSRPKSSTGAQARHGHHGGAQSDHAGRLFGIFLGHTFIVTDTGHEMRRRLPAGDRGRARLISPTSRNRGLLRA